MKKIFTTAMLVVLLCSAIVAQGSGGRERIEAMRVAFITEKLELTVEESQQFWPIYNEYETKRKELRRAGRMSKKSDIKNMTEQEAEVFINASLELEQDLLNLKRSYFGKFKTAISAQKIAKLTQAERYFKQQLLEKVKQRREGKAEG